MLVWVDVSSFPRGLFSGFRRSFFGVCSIHRNHPEMVWHCEEGPTPAPSTFGWTCWAFCLCRWITLSSGQLRKMHDTINRAESAVFWSGGFWKLVLGCILLGMFLVGTCLCFLCFMPSSSKSPPFPPGMGSTIPRWWMLSRMAWTATPLSWERLADPFILGGTGWAWKPRSSSDIPMVVLVEMDTFFWGQWCLNDKSGCTVNWHFGSWKRLEALLEETGDRWCLKQHFKMPISSSTKHNQCI